ncbi:MAG: alkaline phosphatase family protein [Thermoguttaceae bacterium]|jgi:autotransporter-associated beta strand protein
MRPLRPSLALSVGVLVVFAGLFHPARAQTIPKYDHIIVIWEENKDYSTIIGSSSMPYLNNTLLGTYGGVLFTGMYAEQHPSQPNYLDFFSGSNQGVNDDGQYDLPGSSPPGPFTTPNLGASLLAHGYTFKGYAESMPSTGFTGATYTYKSSQNQYALKHCPWVDWQQYPAGNASQANSIPASLSVPYVTAGDNPGKLAASYYFPTNYSQLPTFSMVIPNEQNEMHDGTLAQADAWLKTNMDGYIRWAKTHNSLLIITWDEDGDDGQAQNQHIPTIFVGANLKAGDYSETIDHYNLLRTIEDMYGLPYCTSADSGATPITDVFSIPRLTWTGSAGSTWNTTQTSWASGGVAAAYTDGSQVVFDDTGTKTAVTIQSGGVRPASVTFSNNKAAYTFTGGTIAGFASLVLNGSGTVTLSNTNSYTGGTTINAGTLQLGAAAALPAAGTVTINGGTLGLQSYTPSVAGFTLTGGTLTGTGTLTSATQLVLQSGTVAASLGGSSGALKNTAGTVTLSAGNSYSGGTTVASGTLVAENAAAIPSGSLLDIGAGGSLVLGMTGSQYIEGFGQIAGSPLGSQASGAGGGAMAPAGGDSQAGAGVHAVPEPGTLALLAAAAACGLAAARRRKMRGQGMNNEG